MPFQRPDNNILPQTFLINADSGILLTAGPTNVTYRAAIWGRIASSKSSYYLRTSSSLPMQSKSSRSSAPLLRTLYGVKRVMATNWSNTLGDKAASLKATCGKEHEWRLEQWETRRDETTTRRRRRKRRRRRDETSGEARRRDETRRYETRREETRQDKARRKETRRGGDEVRQGGKRRDATRRGEKIEGGGDKTRSEAKASCRLVWDEAGRDETRRDKARRGGVRRDEARQGARLEKRRGLL